MKTQKSRAPPGLESRQTERPITKAKHITIQNQIHFNH